MSINSMDLLGSGPLVLFTEMQLTVMMQFSDDGILDLELIREWRLVLF